MGTWQMFIMCVSLTAGLSFPEGRLGHLLSTDYLLSQNTHREKEDADIHGCTDTHAHETGFHLSPPHPTLGCNCAWMCVFPEATDTDIDGQRVGGGGWRVQQKMEGGGWHTKMELDAIITVCLWFNGCFCSWLDPSAYNACITPLVQTLQSCMSVEFSTGQELFSVQNEQRDQSWQVHSTLCGSLHYDQNLISIYRSFHIQMLSCYSSSYLLPD